MCGKEGLYASVVNKRQVHVKKNRRPWSGKAGEPKKTRLRLIVEMNLHAPEQASEDVHKEGECEHQDGHLADRRSHHV